MAAVVHRTPVAAPGLSVLRGKLCIWGLSIRLILTHARAGDAGQGVRRLRVGSPSASRPGIGRLVAWRQHRARSAISELCSMRWTCFARGPYDTRGRTAKQGPKRLALPRGDATGAVPPHKTGPPHRALGTSESDCPGAGKVGWGGPDGSWDGTDRSDCPGAGLAGLTRAGWDDTGRSECPGLSRWVEADLTAGGTAPQGPSVQALSRWAGADLTAGGTAPQGPSVQALSRWAGADLTAGGTAPQGPSVQALSRWAGADLTAGGTAPQGPSVQALSRWVGAGLTEAEMAPVTPESPGAKWQGRVGGAGRAERGSRARVRRRPQDQQFAARRRAKRRRPGLWPGWRGGLGPTRLR
ncbi:hypothetical protein LV75_001226 [Actinokineospora diospyrosa]|uniref:Uncharacterized protein n=1 Tax=Actinokineospora diospyrosa TaxID=103728 RepID=A0ABT1I7Y0_9PSEU|nr:hypothetical protein [Actinokineospora diospyrosa]